jgi:hypothetical protein
VLVFDALLQSAQWCFQSLEQLCSGALRDRLAALDMESKFLNSVGEGVVDMSLPQRQRTDVKSWWVLCWLYRFGLVAWLK